MPKRIVVTGGSGKVGFHVIHYLLARGHAVLNLDIHPLQRPLSEQVHTIRVDLADGSQVFSALTSHFKLQSPQPREEPNTVDAVVHLAGYARNMIVSENETFKSNITGTYNVIEAACKLGVPKIILASSICVYGVTYANGLLDFPSFPIDEIVATCPMDAYSLSKLCGEIVAQGFASRFERDIYALRIGAVITPEEYTTSIFQQYVDQPQVWQVHGWSYIDARDLGKICHLCIEKDGLGWQVFNAVNDRITNLTTSTTDFLGTVCPQTPITRPFKATEAPISNRKIKQILCFEQEWDWHDLCSF